MGERATTDFVVYSGDDDFLIPETLERCVQFLQERADYVAANGVSIWIKLDRPGPYGLVKAADFLGRQHLVAERAYERWRDYVRCGLSIQYYVHRRRVWNRAYADVRNAPLKYLGPELLPCGVAAALGKVAELDGLGTVFQQNDSRTFGWYTNSMYELMMSETWNIAVKVVRDSITQAIMDQEGIPDEKARAHVDKELWRHLIFMLGWHYTNHHDEPLHWYDRLKRNRVLVAGYLLAKRIRAGHRHTWVSKDSILSPGGRFGRHFAPIAATLAEGVDVARPAWLIPQN
jgi:hypothetical protein